MRYISTRGGVPACGFRDVVLGGLAADGGLFVPEVWPRFERDALEDLQGRPYQEVAAAVLTPFVTPDLERSELEGLIAGAYADFEHQAIAPLRQLSANEWLLELFHGPTLAFKDIALQLLGRLFEHVLARAGRRITIVGATSGDTGSAAIRACAGRERMSIVILHPRGRISEVQRRQMTTEDAPNVHNVAIEGTFDDCQALLKALFADPTFRDEVGLAAINSINWARIVAQTVYYVTSALALGCPWRRIAFSVPSGNFGNVYAGYVATRLGLPIAQLIVATNRNDILARFFASGIYEAGTVHPTISPSMDIQVASNFERFLFDLHERDGRRIDALMAEFREKKRLRVDADALGRARELFDATRVDEDETAASLAETLRQTGILVDPHTAVGVRAARLRNDPQVPVIALATAHPAKFPDAVRRATGIEPALPARLADLLRREERCATLPNDLAVLKAHVRSCSRQGA